MSSPDNIDPSKIEEAKAARNAARKPEAPKEEKDIDRHSPTVDINHTRYINLQGDDNVNQTDFEFDEDVEEGQHPLIGKHFGDYTIEDSIGRGGMGQVFRAHHRMMDRSVALKILPSDFANDQEMVDRFFLEVKSLGKLLHPNIVTAFDAGQSDGLYFLVMELIQGQSLAQYVSDNGPCSMEKAMDITRQVATALDYAHQRGLIHRDIKPSNLMLMEDGTIKVLDFGLVRLAGGGDENVTEQKRRVVGTVEFMSPEQIRSVATIDHRSDIYSLGATLYFLLAGHPMFSGEPMQVVISHLNEPAPLLFQLRGDIDLRLDGMFQKMVAKKPEDRFESARDLLNFIDSNHLLRGFHGSGASTIPLGQQLSKKLNEFPTKGFGKGLTARRELEVLGIELGMTRTYAAGLDPVGRIIPVPLGQSHNGLENLMWAKQKKIVFGEAAEEARKLEPTHTFQGFQRWIGQPKFEVDFCGRKCPPDVIFAAFLHYIGQQARNSVRNLTHAVVTIPSSYDQRRRISMVTCFRIAGIEVLQLLDKHLAASLARITPKLAPVGDGLHSDIAGHDRSTAGGDSVRHLLVLTLSGSACDAAVVRVEGRMVQTLSTAGDWQFSLRRWKDRLADYLSSEIFQKTKRNIRDDADARFRVKRLADRVLQSIGDREQLDVRLKLYGTDMQWQFTPERLIAICRNEFQAFVHFTQTAIERSRIEISEIDEVLLVGKLLTCRALKASRTEFLGQKIPEVYIPQDELARGAALQGNYLLPPGNPDGPHAIGVSPTDIGIVLQTSKQRLHEPRVLARRGSATPASHSRALRFDRADVQELMLHFLERLRADDSEWHGLTSVKIAEHFPQLGQNDPLQVRLHINQSGIWSANLVDMTHNKSFALPPLEDYAFDDASVQQWQTWLETALLCNW